MYKSKAACANGITAVQRVAPAAATLELE